MRIGTTRAGVFAPWAVVLIQIGCVGHSLTGDPIGDTRESVVQVASAERFFGDDRVGDKLSGHPELVPNSFPEFEELFGVGRHCARESSHEIFVVQETRGRGLEEVVGADIVLPRAVVTGCNTGAQGDAESLRNSFSLMAALVSEPEDVTQDGKAMIAFEPLEVMALDRVTSLYNFYVFHRNKFGGPGDVERVVRDANGRVRTMQLRHSSGVDLPVFVERTDPDDKRCFNCHPNGAPLMNELALPWSNWVSVRQSIPVVAALTEETAALVAEASGVEVGAPSSSGSMRSVSRRASLANELEPIIVAAIYNYVFGGGKQAGVAPKNGFAFGALDGTAISGGLPRLLRSVFCETELNYLSSGDSIPFQLMFDPSLKTANDEFVGLQPRAVGEAYPFLLPVRSEFDRRVEIFLQIEKYLAPALLTAIRLVDDQNDIFSETRCGLLGGLVEVELPKAPAEVNARVRDYLQERLDSGAIRFPDTQPQRMAYFRKLIGKAPFVGEPKATAKAAYIAELRQRVEHEFELFHHGDYRIFDERIAERKRKAKAMFPGPKTPLPVLD